MLGWLRCRFEEFHFPLVTRISFSWNRFLLWSVASFPYHKRLWFWEMLLITTTRDLWMNRKRGFSFKKFLDPVARYSTSFMFFINNFHVLLQFLPFNISVYLLGISFEKPWCGNTRRDTGRSIPLYFQCATGLWNAGEREFICISFQTLILQIYRLYPRWKDLLHHTVLELWNPVILYTWSKRDWSDQGITEGVAQILTLGTLTQSPWCYTLKGTEGFVPCCAEWASCRESVR